MQNVPLVVFVLAFIALLMANLFSFSNKNEELTFTQQHRRAEVLMATPFAALSSILALANGHHEVWWLSRLMYVVSTLAIAVAVWKLVRLMRAPATLYSHIGGGYVYSSTTSVREFYQGPTDIYVRHPKTGELVRYRMSPLTHKGRLPEQLVFDQIVTVDQQVSFTK